MKKSLVILMLLVTALLAVSCGNTEKPESSVAEDNIYIESGLVGKWLPVDGQNLFGYGFEFTDDGHFNFVYAADSLTDYSAFGIEEEDLIKYIDEMNATEPTYRITAANAIELDISVDDAVQLLPVEFELDGDTLVIEGVEYKRQ